MKILKYENVNVNKGVETNPKKFSEATETAGNNK